MKKIIILFIMIIICISTASCSKSDNYIRLRIIANSNSENDILEKTEIKKQIKNLYETKQLNYEHLNVITLDQLLKENLHENLYSKLTIKKCISYYPAKTYKGKFIPSGNYETLLIEIDAAKGNNFWTLLYPEYFGFEFEETNEIEYRSYFYDKLS